MGGHPEICGRFTAHFRPFVLISSSLLRSADTFSVFRQLLVDLGELVQVNPARGRLCQPCTLLPGPNGPMVQYTGPALGHISHPDFNFRYNLLSFPLVGVSRGSPTVAFQGQGQGQGQGQIMCTGTGRGIEVEVEELAAEI